MQNREHSIFVNASLTHVFRTAERYPLFVSHFRERKILNQDKRCTTVRVGYFLYGIPIRWVGYGEKDPYKAITWEQTQGLLKGMRAYWKFDDLGGRTHVSIQTQFTIALPVFGKFVEWVIGRIVSKNVRGILEGLKQAAEGRVNLAAP